MTQHLTSTTSNVSTYLADQSLTSNIKEPFLSTLLRRMRNTFSLSLSPSSPTSAMAQPTPMARSQPKRICFPSLAFSSSPMDIPLKATPSPPSTTSSTSSDSDYLFPSNPSSLSSSPASTVSSSSFTSLSHPDWPRTETLSPSSHPSCSTPGGQASCYISDEDLLDLAQLPLWNDIRIPEHFASYGYGGNPALTAEAYSDTKELPPATISSQVQRPKKQMKPNGGRRRRSKEMRRKPLGIMTPISESGE